MSTEKDERGDPGKDGTSVSVQYSVDGGTDEISWLNEPTQHVRYIRFKGSNGVWEPSGGIRFVGQDAVAYALGFGNFRLSMEPLEQMNLPNRTTVPPFNLKRCRVEVTGCASSAPIVYACADGDGSDCGDCADNACIAEIRIDAGEDEYQSAQTIVAALAQQLDPQCDGAQADCIGRIDTALNCGVANLRALYAIAALSGSEVVEETFTKIVESQGLTRA